MTSLVTSPAHEKIDVLAKNYAARRARVATLVARMDDDIRTIHTQYRRDLREALGTAAGAKDALVSMIREAADLFTKPKTWTLHGLKFGLRKGTGKVEFEIEEDVLVTKLRKRFGEDSEEFRACVEVKHVIKKDALRDLEAKDLAALGVTLEDVVDVPFVKGATSDTDKLVTRLLKESTGRVPEDANA